MFMVKRAMIGVFQQKNEDRHKVTQLAIEYREFKNFFTR